MEWQVACTDQSCEFRNVSQKGKEKVGEPAVPPDSFDGNSN